MDDAHRKRVIALTGPWSTIPTHDRAPYGARLGHRPLTLRSRASTTMRFHRFALVAAAIATLAAVPAQGPGYHIVHSYTLGGDGGWDYLALDTVGHRLFISRQNRVMVVDPETAKQIGKMGVGKALVVDGEFDKNFQLSARNLADVSLLPVSGINVYDIMRSDKLVLTTAALKAIEARLG